MTCKDGDPEKDGRVGRELVCRPGADGLHDDLEEPVEIEVDAKRLGEEDEEDEADV